VISEIIFIRVIANSYLTKGILFVQHANVEYPQHRLRIIVCDDGADPAVETAIRQLSIQHTNLFYHARIKGKVHNYKAGNLQAGIDFSATLPDGPGQIIATLDSDMIVETFWLRALLPHILRDEQMALVAPPQVSLIHLQIEIFSAFKTLTFDRYFTTILVMIHSASP
jgi:cellulose synthase/poly-beta-1,6-N-acetylglucosamine synthase-like glycosyltransferase